MLWRLTRASPTVWSRSTRTNQARHDQLALAVVFLLLTRGPGVLTTARLWLYAGARVHALNLSERHQRIINLGMALALLMVVARSRVSLLRPAAVTG